MSQTGDLWVLGRHRILCGDSTVATDVERVLGGVEPHLMVTDPPYGVNYDPAWRNKAGKSINGTTHPAAAPTHWSFGQLCSLASPGNSPASYFRETQIPAPMIADCLNYNLRFTRGVEDIGVLVTSNDEGSVNELR